MNSLERLRTAAHLDRPDPTPVAPYMGNHGAHVAGVAIGEYCCCGRLMAEAQYRAWKLYGQDAVVPQSDNYYIAEGFGVVVQHYEDSTPTFKTAAIDDLDDIGQLRVPDPARDGRMPVYLEAIRRLRELTHGEVAVRAPGTGPFALAAHLLGTEAFLVELALAQREPGGPGERAIKRLLDLTTDAAHCLRESLPEGRRPHRAGGGFARIARHDFSENLSQVGMARGAEVLRDGESPGGAARGSELAPYLR